MKPQIKNPQDAAPSEDQCKPAFAKLRLERLVQNLHRARAKDFESESPPPDVAHHAKNKWPITKTKDKSTIIATQKIGKK